jgi:hypothetical protein
MAKGLGWSLHQNTLIRSSLSELGYLEYPGMENFFFYPTTTAGRYRVAPQVGDGSGLCYSGHREP